MPEEEAAKKSSETEAEELESSSMPFLAHLEELRTKLVRSAIAVGVCFLVAYFFKEQLYHYLSLPVKDALPPGSKLIYTAPAEAFFTYIKVSFLAALVASSPVIFYQLWSFIAPGLYDHERRLIWPFVTISSVLFIAGAVFCYAVVFPYAFNFFMSFATDEIQPMISLKQYLSFSSNLLLAFGVVFEMPLVLVFLGRLGVVNQQMLRKKRKYAILIMFVAAAFFTPPDVVSQVLMALPLLVLYEISIWMVAAAEKKKVAKEEREETEFAGEDPPEEPKGKEPERSDGQ